MKKLFFTALLMSLSFGCSAEYQIDVPSDAKARYFVLEKTGGNAAVIVTRREGKSGTSFSKRLYDCKYNEVKYLGTGETLAGMASSAPDPNMSTIVPGSIAYYVGLEACK